MLLSPKKMSEAPKSLTVKSPVYANRDLNVLSHGEHYDDDQMMEDGVDLHQFAHLSVEDEEDDDNFQEAFMGELNAADLIELGEDDEEDNEFDEADFRRFQEQMLEEAAAQAEDAGNRK